MPTKLYNKYFYCCIFDEYWILMQELCEKKKK